MISPWQIYLSLIRKQPMVTLCTPTLNRYDLVHKLILSAEQGSLVPDRYCVVDNGGELKLELPQPIMDKVHLYRPESNIGVAASWNYFLRTYPDYVIISNDDIEVGPNTIAAMVDAAEAEPESLFFCIDSAGINAWSFFLERTKSLEIIGPYDENFWPAYFEDNDRYRRYVLAGYEVQKAQNAEFYHFGSATLAAYTAEQREKHHEYFRRNREYYISKWGGEPGNESYRTAFNL